MTDHYTEALNFLQGTVIDAHGDDDRKAAVAQVHATLALAEQQRIANLIALSDADTDLGHIALEKHPDIARTLRIETP